MIEQLAPLGTVVVTDYPEGYKVLELPSPLHRCAHRGDCLDLYVSSDHGRPGVSGLPGAVLE